MSNSEIIEGYKKEIRSILIAYQKGCYLPEFIRSYKEFIGKRLPSRELGYRTDIDFLYSMQDAVRITPTASGEYHLLGIADEKSKHIQKMVFKQKPAKLKVPRRIPRTYYDPPPRFSEPLSRHIAYEPKINTFSVVTPVTSTSNCAAAPKMYESKIRATISIPATTTHQAAPNIYESKMGATVPTVSIPTTTTSQHQATAKEEIVNLVNEYTKGIPLDDLLYEYEDMYGKTFSYTEYGFKSLAECIECISELDLIEKGNQLIVCSADIAKSIAHTDKNISEEDIQNYGESSVNSMKSRHNISARGSIPESMKLKLHMVAGNIPKGILASEFPRYFETVLGAPFDLHSFGYNCLADFIDDASDIFVREAAHGSQKDYIIYPIDEYEYDSNGHDNFSHNDPPEIGASLIDKIIYNIRTILEANLEGIKLRDVLHVYSINCKDSLRIRDLGFNDLEAFLFNIKDRVPLKLESSNGIKSIHLLKLSDSPAQVEASSEACQSEAIPFDAQFPDFKFKHQSLPSNFDATKYIPVFVSTVFNPGHLYIHLHEEANTFPKIADDLEEFYNGPQSKHYLMKNVHIKVDAACAALWPTDEHWYRAKILSIPSMETVHVYYVDYGTRETIPRSLVRYLKKEYTELPAQALRSCLAYLKPPKNSLKWDPKVKSRLLQMSEDLPLMAKFVETKPDGVYSILLCDTNGEKDVYINDVLHKEGFADYIVEDSSQSIPASPEIVFQPGYHSLNPLQALQAQYFLQAFAAVAPSFAQNENYLKLLRQVSMFCPNSDPLRPNSSIPLNPGMHNPNLFSAGMNTFTNPYAMQNSITSVTTPFSPAVYSSPTDVAFNTPISPPVNPQDQYHTSTTYSDIYSPSKPNILPTVENRNNESEVFDEDDDDIFQQFCQKVCSSNVRHVKRVCLGDGYKIHIIVVDSKAYASSGDISQLIWNNKEADYLSRRLQLKDIDFPTVNLSEDGNEECFQQLERLKVKGVQKTTGFKPSILLYPLILVIKILNTFGHPSVSLRTKLNEEIAKFDPNDQIWKEFSGSDCSEPEVDENMLGVTDDDKIERLCLYDLLAMKEGIKCKRVKMMNNLNNSNISNNSKCVDELGKLEQLQEKVLQRIQEIKEICKLFD